MNCTNHEDTNCIEIKMTPLTSSMAPDELNSTILPKTLSVVQWVSEELGRSTEQ